MNLEPGYFYSNEDNTFILKATKISLCENSSAYNIDADTLIRTEDVKIHKETRFNKNTTFAISAQFALTLTPISCSKVRDLAETIVCDFFKDDHDSTGGFILPNNFIGARDFLGRERTQDIYDLTEKILRDRSEDS